MSTQTRTPESAGKTGFQLPKWAGSFGFQIIAALIVGLGLGLLAKYTGST
ncbi:MAG TPA: sodium:proton antiporter, partial [Arthrobacter bacterium]|nr:sodium:proton antiporter [Arthrobacter sp.]